MTTPYLCQNAERRNAVRAARGADDQPFLNGIDFLEVAAGDRVRLKVHFIYPLPGQPGAVPPGPARPLTARNFVIEGGVRITGLRVEGASADGNVLTLEVSGTGDFSLYTLRLVPSRNRLRPQDGFDPALSQVAFSFKIACPSDFDCTPAPASRPLAAIDPEINYLSKDYATFRQLMLDRLSVVMPHWQDRTPADLQVALAEVMAYVGDSLSYYQDAVATEAYLGTARKRISVRRHARLLDYTIHEGSNARAWVCLDVEKNSPADGATLPSGTPLLTGRGRVPTVVDRAAMANVLETEVPVIFETMHDATIHADRNVIGFHTWSDQECCLPKGATRATLVDRSDRPGAAPPLLNEGDVLLFEEILSPTTGLARDADPARRCAVRLTDALPAVDPLTKTPVIEAAWNEADALPFALRVSALLVDSAGRPTVIQPCVARANVVLADHGATIRAAPLVPPSAPATGAYRPTLAHDELTFQGPRSNRSAAAAMQYDVHDARPVIAVSGDGGAWTSQSDLLGSDAFSRDFVVEVQTDGVAHLRFGDGIAGRAPAPGASFTASYRRGSGTRGNVGAEAIGGIVWAGRGISRVRNPIGATGGRDPEALEQVRQFAPQAFRTQERAVTEADYAAMAERNPEVQHAAANFRWTGSWYTAFVTVDRRGGLVADPSFTSAIERQLERYRMAGYDVAVRSPVLVPLDLALVVCVAPGYFRSDVKQSLLTVFGSQDLADGTRGFFHPDNFTFGQSLYLSQIYRAAMQVDGVASLDVTRFQRWGKASNHELAKGVMTAAALEILQLANDPSFPEKGRLELTVAGGL